MLFRGLPRSLILSTGETEGNANHKPKYILHNTYMIGFKKRNTNFLLYIQKVVECKLSLLR